ncbi:MAG: tripartite tricarboxylate transporter substrate binding protein [Betaproteobacteria bacterium]|nr:tripartite tricarboxylate transporter substrate binding protein [Betaproteobacteria bacterium]
MFKVKTLKIVAVLAMSAAWVANAGAQPYPVKTIRFVVSFPPGGATDTFSRLSASEMSKTLGQQVIVENRPGAGTTIAADVVAKAAPDGYTLLFTDASSHAITASLYRKLPYHPVNSFAPVAPLNASPLLLVAHPSVNAKSVKALIAGLKRNPGMPMGNSGIGTVTHMTGEKFVLRSGVKVTQVNYKGGATPIIALMSGEVAVVMATVPASIQHVRQGRLNAIGLAAAKRSPHLPDVPTIGESLPGVEGAVVSAVLAPAGTPAAVIERLNAELNRVSDSAAAKDVYAVNVAEGMRMSPAQFSQYLEREVKEWAEVVKATGVTVN